MCSAFWNTGMFLRDSIVSRPVTTNPVDLNILEHILKPSNWIFIVFCIKHLCAFWFQDGATITELLLPGSLLTTFAASLRAKTKKKPGEPTEADNLEVGVLFVLLPMRPSCQVWRVELRWDLSNLKVLVILMAACYGSADLSPLIRTLIFRQKLGGSQCAAGGWSTTQRQLQR